MMTHLPPQEDMHGQMPQPCRDHGARPMVSIFLLIYNQEAYLPRALDGIFAQQVDFPYEVVAGEDCSTDGSRKMLLDYAARYPDRFTLLLHPRNLGMEGNVQAVRRHCRGRYIACLEGDDYWTDPHKLQTQVDFLEANPEYAACTHRVDIVDAQGKLQQGLPFRRFYRGKRYTLAQAIAGYLPGATSSLVYRNVFVGPDAGEQRLLEACRCVGDMRIATYLSCKGPIRCLPQHMGVYRWSLTNGSYSARTQAQNKTALTLEWLRERKALAQALLGHPVNFAKGYRQITYYAWVQLIKKPNESNRQLFLLAWGEDPCKVRTLLYLLWNTLTAPFRRLLRAICE